VDSMAPRVPTDEVHDPELVAPTHHLHNVVFTVTVEALLTIPTEYIVGDLFLILNA
jgi:hypothetical protein